ncbi:DinB family protein [Sutcliffiella halmapala]
MNELKLIETYKSELQDYSSEQLRHISSEGVWSIGQMYDHVILVAHEYLNDMEACAVSEEEQTLGKTEFGKRLFENGGFPPIKIKLPDELNAPPNNSDTKEELMSRLDEVMQKMRLWETKVDGVNPNYKVQHGGFGWLNAREWYDLVGMHFRHHLLQKEELVEKLRKKEVK